MHLTKRKKVILAWMIPASALVVAGVITVPIIMKLDNDKNQIMNSAQDLDISNYWIDYELYSDFDELKVAVKDLNPSNYSVDFFFKNCKKDSEFLNTYFSFENYGLEKVEGQPYWKNPDGVIYQILDISSSLKPNESDEYVFSLTIEKSYGSFSKKYITEVNIPSSDFSSKEDSVKNFVARAAKNLNSIYNSWGMRFIVNPDKGIGEISQIKNPTDLQLQKNSSEINLSQNNENGSYKITSDDYKYLDSSEDIYNNQSISFIPPINDQGSKLILSVDEAFKFTAKNVFDTSTPLFTFLKSQYESGHLLYLPELTPTEASGLEEGSEDYINRQIQKLIFDANSDIPSSRDEFSNDIPSSTLTATIVKVYLSPKSSESSEDVYTYIVTWTNIMSASTSLIESAPELGMKVLYKDGQELVWNELEANKELITTIKEPSNNLIYEVESVSFDEDDTYKTKAKVTVKISHPELTQSRTYETTITTGFKSKAYAELDDQIKQLVGSGDSINVRNIAPTITTSSSRKDILNVVNDRSGNYSKLVALLTITPPSGLSNVKYTIDSTQVDGSKVQLMLKISSENDSSRYWTIGDVEQLIPVTFDLPAAALVSLET